MKFKRHCWHASKMPQIIPSFIKKTAMERCTFLALAMIPSLPNIQENHIFLKHGSPAEIFRRFTISLGFSLPLLRLLQSCCPARSHCPAGSRSYEGADMVRRQLTGVETGGFFVLLVLCQSFSPGSHGGEISWNLEIVQQPFY
ncbi:hypothetical protein ABFS82_05G088100 [Erythranthe guttata]